jgi:cell division protein ZapB
MDQELDALEDRIRQLMQLCQTLRAENLTLRQQVAEANNENNMLTQKIAEARGRMESLLARIPRDS